MNEHPYSDEESVLLEQLRDEIVAPERKRIRRLEAELTDPERIAERHAEYLPRAIKAGAEKDKELAWSLQPILESSIRQTVRERREEFADAIYPVIGPSITRAIRVAIEEMLQRLNETLATRFSVESLRWRIEAARTGRPFTEVVMLRTLLYRVEQVLLIERNSGVMIGYASQEDVKTKDPSMISALLTALNAFSREALGAKEGLNHLEVENVSVWVETGSRTMIAAVVRGNPPVGLGDGLHQALSRIQLEFAEPLDHFTGDLVPFQPAQPFLASCLREERRAPPKSRAKWIGLGLLVALLALIGSLVGWSWSAQHHFSQRMAALRAEPGLVITSAERNLGHDRVEGLRDPLARTPAEVFRANGFDPGRLDAHFSAYQSLDPEIVSRRVRAVLNPPPGVRLTVTGNEVTASGRAPQAWIDRARIQLGSLGGNLRFSTSRLFSTESAEAARMDAIPLSLTTQRFPPGGAVIQPALADAAAERARTFLREAERAGMRGTVVIEGSTDPTGTPEGNAALARERAENLRAALVERGIPADRLRLETDQAGRREVHLGGMLAEAPP